MSTTATQTTQSAQTARLFDLAGGIVKFLDSKKASPDEKAFALSIAQKVTSFSEMGKLFQEPQRSS